MGEARDLVAAIADGRTTSVEAVEESIGRIEAGDGEINAVVVRDFDRARRAAAEADQRVARGERASLLGLPMTVKESLDIAGLPTTFGHEVNADFIPTRDAVAVERIKRAGAVIVGKTNVPPSLADLQSSNPVYGVTHNPHLHGRSPGGSSGGSAASLAAGFVTAEVGSDIGGSIRTPAAFCGVWGLKPTYGVVSRVGHAAPHTVGGHRVLSVTGPLARSADDLDLLIDVLADHPLAPAAHEDLSGLRVAVLTEHPVAALGSEVRGAVEATAARLEGLGARIDTQPQLPDLARQHAAYMPLLLASLSRGAAREGAQPLSLVSWFDMLDLQAVNIQEWDDLFAERYDAVLAPVFGTSPFPVDDQTADTRQIDVDGQLLPCVDQLGWAGLATYPGLPSVSFPAGRDKLGLPIGLQLMGARYADRSLLPVAAAIAQQI